MSTVDLPVVSPYTTIRAAIELLKEAQRRALVTGRGRWLVVLTDSDLIRTLRKEGDVPISKVAPDLATLPATLDDQGRTRSFEGHLTNQIDDLKTLLRATGIDFAIGMQVESAARSFQAVRMISVVTAHENIAAALGQTIVVCTCPKCKDPLLPGSASTGQKCPDHGETVTCK